MSQTDGAAAAEVEEPPAENLIVCVSRALENAAWTLDEFCRDDDAYRRVWIPPSLPPVPLVPPPPPMIPAPYRAPPGTFGNFDDPAAKSKGRPLLPGEYTFDEEAESIYGLEVERPLEPCSAVHLGLAERLERHVGRRCVLDARALRRLEVSAAGASH